MLSRLSKLRQLGPRAWYLLPGIVFWLTRYHLRPPAKGEITSTTPGQPDRSSTAVAEECALVERVAGALPFSPSCLAVALACRRLLAPVPLQLHLGGRKDGDAFEAHAWLTYEGELVCGAAREPDYEAFRDFGDHNRRSTGPSNRSA